MKSTLWESNHRKAGIVVTDHDTGQKAYILKHYIYGIVDQGNYREITTTHDNAEDLFVLETLDNLIEQIEN